MPVASLEHLLITAGTNFFHSASVAQTAKSAEIFLTSKIPFASTCSIIVSRFIGFYAWSWSANPFFLQIDIIEQTLWARIQWIIEAPHKNKTYNWLCSSNFRFFLCNGNVAWISVDILLFGNKRFRSIFLTRVSCDKSLGMAQIAFKGGYLRVN